MYSRNCGTFSKSTIHLEKHLLVFYGIKIKQEYGIIALNSIRLLWTGALDLLLVGCRLHPQLVDYCVLAVGFSFVNRLK